MSIVSYLTDQLTSLFSIFKFFTFDLWSFLITSFASFPPFISISISWLFALLIVILFIKVIL